LTGGGIDPDEELKIQSGHLAGIETLDHEIFKQKLLEKIESVNFEEAKSDALPFLKDPDSKFMVDHHQLSVI